MATHSNIFAWNIPCIREAGLPAVSPWGHKESDTTEQLSTYERKGKKNPPNNDNKTEKIHNMLCSKI